MPYGVPRDVSLRDATLPSPSLAPRVVLFSSHPSGAGTRCHWRGGLWCPPCNTSNPQALSLVPPTMQKRQQEKVPQHKQLQERRFLVFALPPAQPVRNDSAPSRAGAAPGWTPVSGAVSPSPPSPFLRVSEAHVTGHRASQARKAR